MPKTVPSLRSARGKQAPHPTPLGRRPSHAARPSVSSGTRTIPRLSRAAIPNILSSARLVATPLVAALLLWAPPNRPVAALIFALASVTDYLDGYLARRWNVVSRFGALSDLMADKLLVAATLIALLGIGRVPPWMVMIIIGRELVVSGLRAWAAERGVDIPASIWGKGKTLLTLIAIAIVIVNWSSRLSFALLLAATVLTLLSALDYMYQAWRVGKATY